ncbi:tetratricopeptide repeat protein [Balneolaceae bacterium ANBcel3]|nr:tetratricopeptide repeat protein [Balneolaceae bacterium ANBcel3]
MKTFFLFCFVLLLMCNVYAQDSFNPEVAETLIQSGEIQKAASYLRDHASTNRNNPEWHYMMGHLEFEKNEYRDAIDSFGKAMSLDAESLDYMLWYGNATCSAAAEAGTLRQFRLARRCKASYERVIEKFPDNIEAREHLIRFHLQAPGSVGGSITDAHTLADEIYERDVFRGYMAKFRLAADTNDDSAMISVLEQASATYPDSVQFRYNLGLLYIQSGSYEKAYSEMKVSSELMPGDWRWKYQIGRIAALGNIRLEEGLKAFETLLENEPEEINPTFHSSAYARKAQIYLHSGEIQKAKEALLKAKEIEPENTLIDQVMQQLPD